VVVASASRIPTARSALRPLTVGEPRADRATRRDAVPAQVHASAPGEAVRLLDKARVRITDLSLHRPSLDDVFLALTGRGAEEAAREAAQEDGAA